MKYTDISPRTSAYADRRLLTRQKLNNILGQFGQVRTLPSKKSQTINFRRYKKLAVATTPLVEGVTPSGKVLTKEDVSCTVKQYGDFVMITDVIQDTHEDPVLRESIDVLGEQADETIDILRSGVLKAGTNLLYANGTARNQVNDVVTRDLFRTAIRVLKAQHAKRLAGIVKAGPNIGTVPIASSYIAVCHSDLQPDLERITGWKGIHEYGSAPGNLVNEEAGAIGETRFAFDNNLTPWADAGGTAATNNTLSTTGTNSDVYPILIFGKDAYGVVPLAGKNAVSTYVNNPKASDSDPLAQRGTVGWKTWNGTVILQDLWMLRIETAAKG